MRKLILAIDQGTSSSRVILFDLDGEIVHKFQRELKCSYPQNTWVEQDANLIWQDCYAMCLEAIHYAASNNCDIHSMGITNQRETVVFFDKQSQQALAPAIVWQDRRTDDFCKKLIENGHSDRVRQRSGLIIDAYFSASKINWGLSHIEAVQQAHRQQRLAVGTIDSWLLFKLSGGKLHATDSSNASRTMLFDIVKHKWCDDLLELFDVPLEILPRVLNSIDDYGSTAVDLFPTVLPINALIGDQQSATIGQGCLSIGDSRCTLGTGSFAMHNLGTKFSLNDGGLLTTILFSHNDVITYASEGSVFSSGSTLQWLRDSLNILDTASDSERIARSIDDSGGVYFVPAFSGLGSPHWQPQARAMLCGMSSKTTKNEIVRAALESVSYQCHDLFAHLTPQELKIDGGMAANDWLLQNIADILGCDILRPANIEATAWGAARCAGESLGLLKPSSDGTINYDRFRPLMSLAERKRLIDGWHAAVSSCINHNV
ncbi:MAG: glycerol kinase [Myxococcota bacterium]|jgi:glycerol kinase